MDFNLLLLSPCESNSWNNGRTVGIMWEVAHAAVTNAVIPRRLEAARISSDAECCPTRSAALSETPLTTSQLGAGGRRGGGLRLSLSSAGICFPITASVDSPQVFRCAQFVEVDVCACACLCVLAPASFEGSHYFLTGLSDSHIFSACEHAELKSTVTLFLH